MIVYLGGAINNCSDKECKNWREFAKLKIKNTFDPMDRDYRGKEEFNINEIVELDKQDINNSNCLLVKYTKPSIGTSMEILYAYERNIPTILFTQENNLSPWLIYHCDQIYKTLNEAINEILSWDT